MECNLSFEDRRRNIKDRSRNIKEREEKGWGDNS